jgi:hypothetical protein
VPQPQVQPASERSIVIIGVAILAIAVAILAIGVAIAGQGPKVAVAATAAPPTTTWGSPLPPPDPPQAPAPAPAPDPPVAPAPPPRAQSQVPSPTPPVPAATPNAARHRRMDTSLEQPDARRAACGGTVDFVAAMQYCLDRRLRLCALAEALNGASSAGLIEFEAGAAVCDGYGGGGGGSHSGGTNVLWSSMGLGGSARMWTTSIGDCQPGSVQTAPVDGVTSALVSASTCVPMTSAVAVARCCSD